MAIDLEALKALALLCRDEGIRRARIGDVEVEMAAVRNPLIEAPQPGRPAPKAQPEQNRPPQDEYLDAIGSMAPVIRRRKDD